MRRLVHALKDRRSLGVLGLRASPTTAPALETFDNRR